MSLFFVGKPWKSIVVGHYVGDNALAAVGSATPLLNMLLVLFVGISAGVGIMVSQYFGAKDRERLSGTIGTCITLTAIVSVFLMVAVPAVVRPLLELLNTPDSILEECTAYLVIMMYGIAGVSLATVIAQGVSSVMCLWKLMHMRETFDLGLKQLKMKKDLMAIFTDTSELVDMSVFRFLY